MLNEFLLIFKAHPVIVSSFSIWVAVQAVWLSPLNLGALFILSAINVVTAVLIFGILRKGLVRETPTNRSAK